MKTSGDADPNLIDARTALFDALDALSEHRQALILVGAQAVYAWTGEIDLGVSPFTLDADVALDVRLLGADPLLEAAMEGAGFTRGVQPGIWYSPRKIQVDLLVAASQSKGGTRGARIDGHGKRAARSAAGLEGALVDHEELTLRALTAADPREVLMKVAGPGALVVAKAQKIAERVDGGGKRMERAGKDCTDLLRLLRAGETHDLPGRVRALLGSDVAGTPTTDALGHLDRLFSDPSKPGGVLLERAAPDPRTGAIWSASAAELVRELLSQL